LAADISSGAFSFAWVNPPFDDEIGGGRRVEYSFLTRATQLLVTGGVVVLVLPEPTLLSRYEIKEYLLQHYRQLAVLRFPEEQRRFREVIAVGVKRAAAVKDHATWSSVPVETLTEAFAGEPLPLPVSTGPKKFRRGGLTEEELNRSAGALAAAPRDTTALARATAAPAAATGQGTHQPVARRWRAGRHCAAA
jgi:hypothetical protein